MSAGMPLKGRRVLVHAYERIWPTDCGFHLRCWQVLETLQQLGAEVHILSAHGPRPERGCWGPESEEQLRRRGIQLHLVPFHPGSADFWCAAMWQIWMKRLLGHAVASPASLYYFRPQLERRWRGLLREGKFDATILNYAHWHRLARISRAAGVWCATEMHELLADHFVVREELASGQRPGQSEFERNFAEELQCLDTSDCVLAINAAEGDRVRPRLRANVVDLPFCLSEPAIHNESDRVPPTDILVVGSFIEHNKRGLRQFMEGAWPALKRARPDIRLTVCGRVGEDLAPDPNVTRHLRVPDLTPYYQSASVVLITTVAGAGIKIKTIEALAHGSCIVAHRHSVAGTPFVGGEHGELLDDLGAAAPVILRLLGDDSKRRAFQSRARKLFQSHFSMERSRAILGGLLQTAWNRQKP